MKKKSTFHIHTYGCQMNERDSEIAAGLLKQTGYEEAVDEQTADMVIVNTCSVRDKAEEKALGKLGLLIARRRARPELIVGVTGCMVQRRGKELLSLLPGLDFAVSPQYLGQLPAIAAEARAGGGFRLAADQRAAPPRDQPQPHTPGKTSAFINILYGCNRRCSYCIVPDVRGPEHSRAPNEIVEEARALTAHGTREITLLGQSVMRYGIQSSFRSDFEPSPLGFTEPLPRLLEQLSKLPGMARLRFTSGHPSGCTPELARAMSELPAVCEHLHLPLQSGSDRILKAMRRGCAVEEYRQAAGRLRAAMPDMAITTDIIVGFPGETMADFDATYALMEEVGFDNAFIFKYSPRPGTPAADLPDDVPPDEKLRRNHILLDAQNRRCLAINQRLVGANVEILVGGPSRRNQEKWSGRTRTNKIAIFDAQPDLEPGALIWVEITRVTAQTLFGKIIDHPRGVLEVKQDVPDCLSRQQTS